MTLTKLWNQSLCRDDANMSKACEGGSVGVIPPSTPLKFVCEPFIDHCTAHM